MKNLEIVPGTTHDIRPRYPLEYGIMRWCFTKEEIGHRREQLLEEANRRRLQGRSQYAMFSQYLGKQYPKSRKDALNRLAILSCGQIELRKDKPPRIYFDELQIAPNGKDWSLAIDADTEAEIFTARYDIDTLCCRKWSPSKFERYIKQR